MKKKEEKGDLEKDLPEEKKLIWKLSEKPTAEAVAQLVDTEVITPAEARDILFREETKKQSDEVEALKEMVNALQDLVKDLLDHQSTTLTVWPYTKVIKVPTHVTPYWDRYLNGSGTVWCNTSSSSNNGTTAYTLSLKQ